VIDWLSGRITLPIPLPQPIHDGYVLHCERDGSVSRQTAKRLSVQGSFEASTTVRAPCVSELEFGGNLAKFLQGHNLWGPECPVSLLWATLQRIEQIGGVFPVSLADMGLHAPQIVAQCTVLNRADCTQMVLADSPVDVESALRALRVNGRLRDRGASGLPYPWKNSLNVSFGSAPGKSVQHRAMTAYHKGPDVRRNPLPDLMMNDPAVIDLADRSLRFEMRHGRLFLRKPEHGELHCLANWKPDTSLRLWSMMMDRLDLNDADVKPAVIDHLPARLRVVYAAWCSGADLRQIYARPTFYRHRKALLEAAGVDIAIPRATEATATVIPIKRIIQLTPIGRPDFADRVEAQLREAGAYVFPQAA
jgi:II/X family phage/plasmid replication protein